jgi:hypothetical protein
MFENHGGSPRWERTQQNDPKPTIVEDKHTSKTTLSIRVESNIFSGCAGGRKQNLWNCGCDDVSLLIFVSVLLPENVTAHSPRIEGIDEFDAYNCCKSHHEIPLAPSIRQESLHAAITSCYCFIRALTVYLVVLADQIEAQRLILR